MDEIELLRAFRDRPEPDRASVAEAAAAARERGLRRRRPRAVPAVAIAAAIACVAVLALVVRTGGDDGRLGVANAQAASVLRSAAALPLTGPSRPLEQGEYWYVKRRTRFSFDAGDRYRFVQPAFTETWTGVDGSWRVRTVPYGPPIFPTPRDRAHWLAGGRLMGGLGKTLDERFAPPVGKPAFYIGNEGYSYEQLVASLPSDPDALYRMLHDAADRCDCGNSVDEETFVFVGDLLRGPPLPQDLRAALLRAAARIPGIKLVPDAQDLNGRPGIGVAYGSGVGASMLVFDRRTHAFLGESEGKNRGSVDLASGIVSSPDERP